MTTFNAWRTECLEETGETRYKTLYANFKEWCTNESITPIIEKRSFGVRMTRFYPKKRRDAKGLIYPVTIK